jgi:catechol 2,3-dioxygenase-like lactoylglutathione lyase family enzyme
MLSRADLILRALPALAALLAASSAPARAEAQTPAGARAAVRFAPRLHHVGLNTVDPERAIAWYLKLWPTAARTTIAGFPAVQGDMALLFNKVDRPAPGAWRDDLHRADQQSAFWHIGANTDATTTRERLAPLGIVHLPLFIYPNDTIRRVWRSGLAPYAGTPTAAQLATIQSAPPRDGGFSYVVAPDGVLFELTGGPGTHDSFSHIHFFHEQPLCAANWYVAHLGMELPPVRDSTGTQTPRAAWTPCDVKYGEASWPALEPVGTIRQPQGTVRFANGSMSWYPRQCVGTRCGHDQKFVPSRGQVLDHVAFSVENFDALYESLRRDGVKILEPVHAFGDTRAFMLEDPDGLAIEILERKS